MNIKITYNWLLDFIKTDADPYEIQKYLSLCGPAVERIEKIGDDFVFDIEITSNRVDCASVIGIAREMVATLPQFGKYAKFTSNPIKQFSIPRFTPVYGSDNFEVSIIEPDLAQRILAVVLADIEVSESPKYIRSRLEMCGIRSINNIVDISNYLMLSLGQPNHIFDFDKIAGSKFIVRSSKAGERIKTLDDRMITLSGGDIVIEDGGGHLMDLAGIMGGYDSMIDNNTKKILFFLETYNKTKIRRTSMLTGQRTQAATYFEKGLDCELIGPVVDFGVKLLNKHANAKISSKIIDIYPDPKSKKTVQLDYKKINDLIGVKIEEIEVNRILKNLSFDIKTHQGKKIVEIPFFRDNDIDSIEDLSEEVVRIYGLHRLPGIIQQTEVVPQPTKSYLEFEVKNKIRYFLKSNGVNEIYNYSMISEKNLQSFGLKLSDHLKIVNSISQDIEYLRSNLYFSLVNNIKENAINNEKFILFEIAKVYHKKFEGLPDEKEMFTIATTTDYHNIKGLIDNLFKFLNIKINYEISTNYKYLDPRLQINILIDNHKCGLLGKLDSKYQLELGISQSIFICEIELDVFVRNYRLLSEYVKASKYATIIQDLTYQSTPQNIYEKITSTMISQSKMLKKVYFINSFKDKITLRLEFNLPDRNLTEKEAIGELLRLKEMLKL